MILRVGNNDSINRKKITNSSIKVVRKMSILQKIVDMDKAAAARVEMAVEEERRLSDESGEGSAKVREETLARERAKAEAFCAEQQRQLNEKLSKADKTLADECGKLNEKFAAHKAEWKAEIMARITEG